MTIKVTQLGLAVEYNALKDKLKNRIKIETPVQCNIALWFGLYHIAQVFFLSLGVLSLLGTSYAWGRCSEVLGTHLCFSSKHGKHKRFV